MLVCPGQGAQYVGMGKDIYDTYAGARMAYRKTDDALEYKLSEIIFEGSKDDDRDVIYFRENENCKNDALPVVCVSYNIEEYQYEEVVKKVDSKFAAKWMRDELKRVLSYNKLDYAESEIGVESLVELFNMLLNKEITTKAGQRIIEQMPNNEKSPKEIAEEMGLLGVVKDDEVLAAVKQAIDENPKAVQDYHDGQKASLNFLVGQVMRLTRGKADPGETVKLLKENIE